MDVDGAVDVGRCASVAKMSDAPSYATSTRAGQVGAIRLHVQDHVAGREDEFVVWVGRCIGREAVHHRSSGLSSVRLVG